LRGIYLKEETSLLKNPDGTPYKPTGSLEQFDPDNPERCLWNDWDAEIMKIYGSPVFYYEVFIQTGSLDKLYREDRGKIWSNNPITLYASYEPVAGQNYQSAFGIDSPDEVIFDFNYRDVVKRIGHPPKIGSRIFTPHRNEDCGCRCCASVSRRASRRAREGSLRRSLTSISMT
jgi:hypothetical protein